MPLPSLPRMALCRCGASALCGLSVTGRTPRSGSGTKGPGACSTGATPMSGSRRRSSTTGARAPIRVSAGPARTAFRPDRGRSSPNRRSHGRDHRRRAGRCPSERLAAALGGHEAREQVDQEREQAIEVSKDSPYRVTGGLPLEDADGNRSGRNGRLAGALQPRRCGLAEQAVLQRQALAGRLPRSRSRPGA